MLIHYIGTNLREPLSESGFKDANLQTEHVNGQTSILLNEEYYRPSMRPWLAR